MKTLTHIKTIMLVLIISFIFLKCDILKGGDSCDSTIAPEISVSIKAVVHVRDKNNLKIKDQRIELSFFKKPCGAEEKGNIEFKGVTDSDGNFYSTIANYSLRNKEDKVGVNALDRDIVVGYGASSSNYQLIYYRYDDFISEMTKTVDITLYTDK